MLLNKSEYDNKCLWLSESSALNGALKNLSTPHGMIEVFVPKGSTDGSIIKMKGYGKKTALGSCLPFSSEKTGFLQVRVRTYPDYINPEYKSFSSLNTDAMALEGWIYLKIDEIIAALGRSILNIEPIIADTIADLYNQNGWMGIFNFLRSHLKLSGLKIEAIPTDSMTKPGECQPNVTRYANGYVSVNSCRIYINKVYLDDPICVAAILAHELCHVVHTLHFLQLDTHNQSISDKQTLEQERMVDLLVFMHRIGGFQIRVSRARQMTLGYFDQETFDRMFVIVLKEIKKRRSKSRL